MKFLYPDFLWALWLLVIPIALHLFHLRRFKVFYFSNVSFLKQLDVVNKSTRKIKEWLVLLLRVLAIIFLILAFAQPYRPLDPTHSSEQSAVTAILIDNSLSMSAIGPEGELLSQAKEFARKLIQGAHPGHQYLILSSSRANEETRLKTKVEALDYIDKLTFSNANVSSDELLRYLSGILKDLEINPRVVVVSDGQSNQWLPKESHSLESDFLFMQLQPSNSHNVAVDSVWTDRPLSKPGMPFEMNIRLRKYSENPLESIPVTIKLNEDIQQFTAQFESDGFALMKASYVTPKAGIHELTIEIEDEQVHFDDELYAAFTIGKELNVGIINESDVGNQLEIVYGLDSYFRVRSYTSNQLPIDELNGLDLIIVNQLKEISPVLEQKLTSISDNGATLVFIPHSQANLPNWNRILLNQNLPTISKSDTSRVFISEIHIEHFFFKGMFDQTQPKIRIPINRNHKLEMGTSRALPLLSFSDQSPFLIKSTVIGKRMFLFNSNFAGNNQAFLNSDLFSALFLRIGEISNFYRPLYHFLGSSFQVAFNSENDEETPISIRTESAEFIPRQNKIGKTIQLVVAEDEFESEAPGIYNVLIANQSLGKLALNRARSESELVYADATELTQAFQNAGIDGFETLVADTLLGQKKFNQKNEQTYWRFLLILALCALITEMLLVRFWRV
jgi:hypothetical protein